MNHKSKQPSRRRNIILLGVLFSVLFFWLAVRNVKITDVVLAFQQSHWIFGAPILLMLLAYYWLKALRWSNLLAPVRKLSIRDLAPPMMIGLAANNLLPAHLGELVRMYLLARQQQIANSTVLATLVAERFFDIVSILLLVSIAVAGSELSAEFMIAGLFLLGVAIVILVSMIFLVIAHEQFVRFVSICMRSLSGKLAEKVIRQLEMAATGLESLRSWRVYPGLFLNSVLQWLLMGGAILLSMKAFNVTAPPESAILVLGLIVAGITLPSSPGFFGTVEFCFVLGLSVYDIDASVALSTAIFYHVLTWGLATVTGLMYLRFSGLKMRDIRSPTSTYSEPM